MKKRLLATVLAVAMMGTLAACGNGTKTDSAGNDAEHGGRPHGRRPRPLFP